MGRTPLDSLENCRLQWLRKPGMHRASLLLLALESLKVLEATFASDLALELFEAVKGHPGGVSP
jgi:hypothetical protein